MNDTRTSMNIGPAPTGADADAAPDAQIIINNNQPRAVPPTNYTLNAPDLSARRYGEDTLNSTVFASDTQQPSTARNAHINWGGVVKGALIVTAVVVAAVVVTPIVAHYVGAALTSLSASPTFGPIIGGLHSAALWSIHQLAFAVEFLTHLGGLAWGGLTGSAASVATTSGATALTAAQIAPLANGAGAVAGGVTAVAGLTAAAPVIGHLHLIDPGTSVASAAPHDHASLTADDSWSGLFAAKKAVLADAAHTGAETAHQATDLAHHSAAHGEHDRHSRDAVLRAKNASKAWTERVNPTAASAAKTASIAPRSSSYAEQVDADTAKLNAALAGGPAA